MNDIEILMKKYNLRMLCIMKSDGKWVGDFGWWGSSCFNFGYIKSYSKFLQALEKYIKFDYEHNIKKLK